MKYLYINNNKIIKNNKNNYYVLYIYKILNI